MSAGGQGAPAGEAFAGFWMGGYEGADHVNGFGQPLDMAAASGHLERLDEDHRLAAAAGIRCVRESIGWRLAEDGAGRIDLQRALRAQASARRHGLQVLWTLMHYGVPPGLSLHDDALVPRLARFAAEVVRMLAPGEARPMVVTPVNEIGFLAWAASATGLLAPPNGPAQTPTAEDTAHESGYAVKRRLARAAIAAMQVMREVDPRVRFLHVEPVVHVVPPHGQPELQAQADTVRSWQWQAWDLLCGRLEPALGGHPGLLDLVGVNHYHSSQWELHTEARLDWFGRDPRRAPFASLLAEAWQRYGRPLVVAETSHVGIGRAPWLHDIAHEVRRALQAGVPVQGLCLYPLVDRPDWQNAAHWHRSGVWDVDDRPVRRRAATAGLVPEGQATAGRMPLPAAARLRLQRHPAPGMLQALQQWQAVLPGPSSRAAPRDTSTAAPEGPVLLVFSHLRWDFVRHRTRHLVEGLVQALSPAWQLAVVEEPLQRDGPARLDQQPLGPQLTLLVPHTPSGEPGFGPAQAPQVLPLLQAWLAAQGVPGARPLLAWLSTPMAWPLAQQLAAGQVVLDCADELAGFLGAPPGLQALHDALLQQASLVLAAGPALAAARAAAAPRLRLVCNGVDRRLHARHRQVPGCWAHAEALRVWPAEASPGSGPVLGYAGVIDERMDLQLLAALVQARPHWRFVMVGPVLKIAQAALPQAPNLLWLGQQPAELLPQLMRRWQLTLLPWQLHAATVHAHPLKVLEALAAGLPVVATALPDLLPWRAAGVATVAWQPHAGQAEAVLQACDGFLAEAPAAGTRRRRAARALLRRKTWQRAALACARALQRLSDPPGQATQTDTHSEGPADRFAARC